MTNFKHFTWHDAVWLPSWNREATQEDGLTDEICTNLIHLFLTMDKIRDDIKSPVIVHCAYRPVKYNQEVGGATHSKHVEGLACDFHVKGTSCDDMRMWLEPRLRSYLLRMEWLPGSNWIHVDLGGKPGIFLP